MLIDTSTLSDGQSLDADVCIVGGGAAGISIARALANTALKVVLLEGGGFAPTERSQELYDGEMATIYREGTSRAGYDRTYVGRSRLRYFGGTTNHWNGWCRPLEPSDFATRDWVPRSGWPVTRELMDPWYAKARELVEIPEFEEDHGYGRKPDRRQVCLADNADIVTRLFHWSPPTRFGKRWRQPVVDAPNVRLILEANVLRLAGTEGRDAVTHAEVQIEDGPRIQVRAKRFVVSCGGIENARLLLLSELGGDNVGRFFMEHPHVSHVGQIVILDQQGTKGLTDLYFAARKDKRAGGRSMGVFATSDAFQKEHQSLAFCLQLRDRKKEKLNKVGKALLEVGPTVRDLGTDVEGHPKTPYGGRLFARGEQVPNPDSRVTLTDETDRLGLRKARLAWQLGDQDLQSIHTSMEAFARHFGSTGIGRVRIKLKSPDEWPKTRGGDHHLGTTRMAADPTQGVVDAHCKVHGIDNLYMAGSSVFATSGFANPTFTITALALRLADHLKGLP
ncbi:MAG: GMC family oxidoreductase [Proteobacteria bacterium]|nr:GMC family oxidoreductase [Pseudomonadota bacterium]